MIIPCIGGVKINPEPVSLYREINRITLSKFWNIRYYGIRKKVMRMDTRRKIIELLNKITSQRTLDRIYRFVRYVYIHGTE